MDKETKNSFQQVNANIENLAVAVKRGFDAVDKRFEQVDARFESIDMRFESIDTRFEKLEAKVDDGFSHVNARLLTMERDIAEIRAHFVYREEFEDMMARLKYVEKKLNIESGK